MKKDSEPAESFVLIRSVVMDSGMSLHSIIPSVQPTAAQSQQSWLISFIHISISGGIYRWLILEQTCCT